MNPKLSIDSKVFRRPHLSAAFRVRWRVEGWEGGLWERETGSIVAKSVNDRVRQCRASFNQINTLAGHINTRAGEGGPYLGGAALIVPGSGRADGRAAGRAAGRTLSSAR